MGNIIKLALIALCLTLVSPTVAKPGARVLTKTGAPITALSYAPDGKTLAIADQSGRVALTDAKSGKTTQSFRYKQSVKALAFAPNGKVLAIGVGTICPDC